MVKKRWPLMVGGIVLGVVGALATVFGVVVYIYSGREPAVGLLCDTQTQVERVIALSEGSFLSDEAIIKRVNTEFGSEVCLMAVYSYVLEQEVRVVSGHERTFRISKITVVSLWDDGEELPVSPTDGYVFDVIKK